LISLNLLKLGSAVLRTAVIGRFSLEWPRAPLPWARGVKTGGKEAQFPDEESLRGSRNDCGRRKKSQQCHKYFLKCNSLHWFRKTL